VAAVVGLAAAGLLAFWGAPIAPASAASKADRWRGWTGRTAAAVQVATAERLLRSAEHVVGEAKAHAGLTAVDGVSPLIGEELTGLVTTLGSLEAKRTATNPRWAGVLVQQFVARGLGRGDVIAAGFSGSFPGLNLAVTCAARAIGAEVIAVSSVTASTWGANQPGFTWPEIEVLVVEAGLFPPASAAVSAGGEADMALDLEPAARTAARAIRDRCAKRLHALPLAPASARDAIDRRLAVYRRAANGRRIALYANVGGASASLGSSAAVLRLRSGFLPPGPFDWSPGRGVMARLAEQGVPVLTLLNVRDLALRWGIPLG
jgi:poly-gamma-glutamate system protein